MQKIGTVYALTNEAMPGFVKIGRASEGSGAGATALGERLYGKVLDHLSVVAEPRSGHPGECSAGAGRASVLSEVGSETGGMRVEGTQV